MALQGPFFGKRDNEPATPSAPRHSGALGGASTLGSAGAALPSSSLGTPAGAASPAAAARSAAAENSAKLTVGPNIKLKGVEISDCDTVLIEGTVEASIKSRVIQIAESGTYSGSAEIDLAEVRGVFDGQLTVREKLVIFATGKVTGKVQYGKIVVEEGGQLSGDVSVVKTPAASVPASSAPAVSSSSSSLG